MGVRELTAEEKAEINELRKEISLHKTGIALAEMKIDYIESRPTMEYSEWLAAEPLEF